LRVLCDAAQNFELVRARNPVFLSQYATRPANRHQRPFWNLHIQIRMQRLR
jgi:hypothetical protein